MESLGAVESFALIIEVVGPWELVDWKDVCQGPKKHISISIL